MSFGQVGLAHDQRFCSYKVEYAILIKSFGLSERQGLSKILQARAEGKYIDCGICDPSDLIQQQFRQSFTKNCFQLQNGILVAIFICKLCFSNA